MPIGFDTATSYISLRQLDSAKATETAARNSVGSFAAVQRQAAQVQQVAPASASDRSSDRNSPSAEREDNRRFAREAPNGPRPRYVPKGQSLNILV